MSHEPGRLLNATIRDPQKEARRPTNWSSIRAWKGWSVFIVHPATNQSLLETWHNRRSNSPNDMQRYVHVIGLHRTTGHVDRIGTKSSPEHRNVWKSDTFDGAKLDKRSHFDLDGDV